jgi:23S rRNA pseudouridine2605 synthase/23S rRNA pseudouridine2604 synthase
MPLVRLQKFLSAAGYCSRRQGEKYIQAGKVKVNGNTITELGTKVDPEKDTVEVEGKLLTLEQPALYIALNKPEGYVTSCRQKNEKLVVDLIGIPDRIYPIGRLDKDSTGLLLLTNDGRLHHRLLHPSFDHEKEYDVTVAQAISDDALQTMADGMLILGEKTRPAMVRRLSARRFRIKLKEGKNRQIRRMVRKLGNNVLKLKRLGFASIRLGSLPEGSWRYLTSKEQRNLMRNLDINGKKS